MKKIITINGMNCGHCKMMIENALNAIQGVEATVNLKKKQATVEFENNIDDQVFKDAVSEAGFEAVSVVVKKGLFGN